MRRCHSTNFTFHDVSINTVSGGVISTRVDNFTFHDVSINTETAKSLLTEKETLHSTMFLLIPIDDIKALQKHYPLHSTMFLLIQRHIVSKKG